MHSSLAVTTAGVPLGLAAVKFWTRSKFKGTAALKRKVNPTVSVMRRMRLWCLDLTGRGLGSDAERRRSEDVPGQQGVDGVDGMLTDAGQNFA